MKILFKLKLLIFVYSGGKCFRIFGLFLSNYSFFFKKNATAHKGVQRFYKNKIAFMCLYVCVNKLFKLIDNMQVENKI